MASGDSMKIHLISQIQNCLDDYRLEPSGPVIVGLSGGKDSITLSLLLKEMGIEVIPVIVDLGYRNFRALSIASSVAKYGLRARIISGTNFGRLADVPTITRDKVQVNLKFLACLNEGTPCGVCSQTKRILLVNEAKKCDARWIALAHHRDDFLVTLLKDYFIHEYHEQLGGYSAEKFKSFIHNSEINLSKIEYLIQHKLASTMALRLRLADSIELVRPMLYVAEKNIVEFVRELDIKPFGSGCSHEVFISGQLVASTKREIVHVDLQSRLQQSPEIGDQLLAVALKSLDNQGYCHYNPRAMREKRLPGFEEG